MARSSFGADSIWDDGHHETDVSAEQSQTQEDSRVPDPHAHARRATHPGASTDEGAGQALRLRRAGRVFSSPRRLGSPVPVQMSSAQIIRRGVEFRRVLRGGRPRSGSLVIAYVQVSDGPTRAGFVSGRGVGGAVERNRARRLLREAWRSVLPSVRPGLDVVLVARPEMRGVRLADVESDVRAVLRAGGVIES